MGQNYNPLTKTEFSIWLPIEQALLCSIELGSTKCNIETAKIGIFLWEKYVHHNRETTKIGIRTPLKLYVYFRFVSETTGI